MQINVIAFPLTYPIHEGLAGTAKDHLDTQSLLFLSRGHPAVFKYNIKMK